MGRTAMNGRGGVHRWELRGIGHLDPQLLGDAAVYEGVEGTIVIGTWKESQLIDLLRALETSGFDVLCALRLDEQP